MTTPKIYLSRFTTAGGSAALKPADERSHTRLAHLWGATREPWRGEDDTDPLFIFEDDDLEPTIELAEAHRWRVIVL